jgi:hypothetical protein
MQRIELKTLSGSDAAGVLYTADHPANRLLLWIGGTGDIEKLATALTAEDWNVLHVGTAPDANADAIIGALAAAASHGDTSTGPLRIVAVAEPASVPTACAAVLETHRRGNGTAIAGLVTIDDVSDGAASLVDIADLTTLIVARRHATQARQSGLAWHRRLQAQGRDVHFMVLEDGGSLMDQLTDPRDPLGREVRWLLDPVNSRTAHLVR